MGVRSSKEKEKLAVYRTLAPVGIVTMLCGTGFNNTLLSAMFIISGAFMTWFSYNLDPDYHHKNMLLIQQKWNEFIKPFNDSSNNTIKRY